MVIQEMTEQECRAMLAGSNVARLECAHDNQPYIVPIHIDLDGEFLYCYATLGQKIAWIWWEPASVPLAAHEQRARIVFRIRVGRVTGRRSAPD